MALATGALALQQDVPNPVIFAESNSVSTSDASLNRRHVRIPPKNDSNYGPQLTREFEFTLGSNTSFADFTNMYITGVFKNLTKWTIPTAAVGVEGTLLATLEKGGINALFETVVIENASTGAVIQRIENYNTKCAVMASLEEGSTDAQEEKMVEFDGLNQGLTQFGGSGGRVYTKVEVIDAVAGVAAITPKTTSSVLMRAEVGDVIDIEGVPLELTGVNNATAVTSSGTTLTIAAGSNIASVVQVGSIMSWNIIDGDGVITSTERAVVTVVATAGTVYTFVGITNALATFIDNISVENAVFSPHERVSVVKIIPNATLDGLPTLYLSSMITQGHGSLKITLTKLGQHESIGAHVGSSGNVLGTAATAGIEAQRFQFRPRMGFFFKKKYYPLFLHASGIRIRCILDPSARRSFQLLNDHQTAWLPIFDYEISDLRLNIPVYDLHSSVNRHYYDAYTGAKGLLFPMKSYAYQKNTATAGGNITSGSISMNIGVRSACSVVSRLTTDLLSTTDTIVCQNNPSIGAHPLLGLQKFQYSSGALVFPQREVIRDTGERYFLEMRKHQQILKRKCRDRYEVAFDGAEPYHKAAGQMWSLPECDRKSFNYVMSNAALHQDTKNGVLTAVLAREVEGRFAGLDLSVQPLKAELTFDVAMPAGIGASRSIETFIEYDAYVHMGQATGVAVLY